MSIPGLGQIPVQTTAAAPRTFKLASLSEWRFAVSQPAVKVRVLSGTAERDGTELAMSQTYSFAGTQSKILTWHGCEIEVDGACDSEEVIVGGVKQAEGSTSGGASALSPMISYINLHLLLASQRASAASMQRGSPAATGPRLLVCGPPHSGRTSLVRMLTAWATKMASFTAPAQPPQSMLQQAPMPQHQQPCVVNVDPREGMLSLPGTLSAAVFATLMDLETEGGSGWGGAPSSGPSAVPVKLPLVYNYGYARPSDAPDLYRDLVTRLAGAVSARMSEDTTVEASGLLIDTPAVTADENNHSKNSAHLMTIDTLAHIMEEFSVNLVVVLGTGDESNAINQALTSRFSGESTTLGEPVQIVQLDASDGVVDRSDSLEQQQREACIKEYFFGDAKRTLSPYTQQVDADTLTVFRLPPADNTDTGEGGGGDGGDGEDGKNADEAGDEEGVIGEHNLEKVDAGPSLAHWTLAVMNAGLHDPPDVIQHATVLGFVYVAEVDAERRKVRILAPVSGRLGDRPLVFGRWPEPYINLVG
ncbi:Cleavage polyadenylation factor subunit clp1 [Sporothrix curviconia]|uniref:Polynucleotide 5'-hydroxyl-kinase GRC3 n=1 Tax=Sporothrix curviconia TaxID=1260050 RepID=A0ABP0BSI1_9PEZI